MGGFTLLEFLLEKAVGRLLPWQAQCAAAEKFALTLGQVEEAALAAGLLPARYQRNQKMLTTDEQLRLFKSSLAVVGCGGLGGYVIELVARLGIGHIIAIDPDTFEESNLNRQLLATINNLGQSKAKAAFSRVKEINPAVTVTAYSERLCRENGETLLNGAQIVIDALDNIGTRLELAKICQELALPLVHGAIAGWYGQLTSQYPGKNSLQKIYCGSQADRGAEKELGNPSFTPAVTAAMQVAEACKILLGKGNPLYGLMLCINLLEMEAEAIIYE